MQPPGVLVRRAVRAALEDLMAGERVVVALSGGPDSLALLAATVAVAEELGLVCGSVVVDHGLQPDSSAVATRAAGQARLLGCADVAVVRVAVADGPGVGGPEAAARRARYEALDRVAAASDARPGAAAVLLGHTRDDQAETVLLGLARGSGTRAVAGMAPRAGLYRRPLLDLPREVVHAAAAALARADPRLEPWRDPHNSSDRYARVRVRRTALPALRAALGPTVPAALARTARLARQDADALDAWADQVWDALQATGDIALAATAGGPAGPSRADAAEPTDRTAQTDRGTDPAAPPGEVRAVGVVAALRTGGGPVPVPRPPAIRTRLVRRLLVAAGCPPGSLSAEHVERVDALVAGRATSRAEVALPGGLRARREGPLLRVRA